MEIKKNLQQGMTPRQAVNKAYSKYPVMEAVKDELVSSLTEEAKRGGASDVPDEELEKAMQRPWSADGLNLSERTTQGEKWVVLQAAAAITEAVKEGNNVKAMAKSLFDGYGHGGIIPAQDIPKFMDKVISLTADYQSPAFKLALRGARRNIDKLTTRGMKAAYNGILEAIADGNQKKLDNAIYVATQERTRYFAERIARTEKARAYADGVVYEAMNDEDCVALHWKLSSRHPVNDICDLYAHADLWGMGEGIFPKDKVPNLPVHPNCMCKLIPVVHGSLKLKSETPIDQRQKGGMKYINSLSSVKRASLLGVHGAKKVMAGADWRKYARGFSDKIMVGRIEGAQDYKIPQYGEKESNLHHRGRVIRARPVQNTKFDMYVSSKVHLKPKMFHEMESQLNECIKLMHIEDMPNFPSIVISSGEEMGMSLGSYEYMTNRLYIHEETLLRKTFVAFLQQNGGFASSNRLVTLVHELYHWLDAQQYIKQYGKISDGNEYINYICREDKRKFDKLIKKGYNMAETSQYASYEKELGRYDEVYTEYRTRILLKER